MDTLIEYDKEKLLSYANTCNQASDFQKKLIIRGFPYAHEVDEKTFEEKKQFYLTHNCINVCNKQTVQLIKKQLGACSFLDGVERLLNILYSYGDLVILSNYYEINKIILNEKIPKKLFKRIILSCDFGERKPSIKLFKYLNCEEYDLHYYFGDNWTSDVIPALQMGFYVFYINKNDQFIQYIYNNGIQFMLERNGSSFSVKKQYKEVAVTYFGKVLNIEKISPKELFIENGKIYFELQKKVKYKEQFREIMLEEVIDGPDDI